MSASKSSLYQLWTSHVYFLSLSMNLSFPNYEIGTVGLRISKKDTGLAASASLANLSDVRIFRVLPRPTS